MAADPTLIDYAQDLGLDPDAVELAVKRYLESAEAQHGDFETAWIDACAFIDAYVGQVRD